MGPFTRPPLSTRQRHLGQIALPLLRQGCRKLRAVHPVARARSAEPVIRVSARLTPFLLNYCNEFGHKDKNGRCKYSGTAQTGTRAHRSSYRCIGATRPNHSSSRPSTKGDSSRAGRSTRTSHDECCRPGKNSCRTAGTVGEAEGQDCAHECCCEEGRREAQANESCCTEEAVRDDEGTVGRQEESGVIVLSTDCGTRSQ